MQDSSSVHHGGALGAAGLVLTLAGCAYLAAGAPGASAQAWWPMPTRHIQDMPVPQVDTKPEAETLADAPSLEPIAPPANTLDEIEEPVLVPAQAMTLRPIEATFIVKFKPDPEIDDVIAGWRTDREASIEAFRNWAEGDPLFEGMTLEGCSYSGELLLKRRVELPEDGARRFVSALTSDIRGHSAVAYADPDFTAHPGTSSEDE